MSSEGCQRAREVNDGATGVNKGRGERGEERKGSSFRQHNSKEKVVIEMSLIRSKRQNPHKGVELLRHRVEEIIKMASHRVRWSVIKEESDGAG